MFVSRYTLGHNSEILLRILQCRITSCYYPLLKYIRYGNKSHFSLCVSVFFCSCFFPALQWKPGLLNYILLRWIFTRHVTDTSMVPAIMESVRFEWIVVNGTDDVAFRRCHRRAHRVSEWTMKQTLRKNLLKNYIIFFSLEISTRIKWKSLHVKIVSHKTSNLIPDSNWNHFKRFLKCISFSTHSLLCLIII